MRAAAGLLLAALFAGPVSACAVAPWEGRAMDGSLARLDAAAGPVAAWYEDPTTRYAHGVLGDAVEAGTLAVQIAPFPDCRVARVTLPEVEVFEDLAPRLADLDGDGRAELVVVQSHRDLGARLVVYAAGDEALTLAAATPNIGRPNRWLAPVGAADLDGDGLTEIAYIDRPHLARTLRVWRYGDGRLTEVAALEGLTNHRIGDAHIPGGLRDCGDGPEIITADAGWTAVMATRLTAEGRLDTRPLGPWSDTAAAAALACAD
ncbi:FG-GAP repeat domain-containing protein [Roseicyclus persicicus]|uniref:VCBS repeat-containing protein n=1 Tax=Roseicyclus persicicus TaxID=2650661 RepID=A0A7X6GWH7_9RHOB|nr:VCBS repeat-containing protein [Roseibacterium persicicum]NKX43670.1 VCBS repeat-containing protein [Roseibacterium persicicum]